MARNRPGKRERQAAKRNAFQETRAAIVAANLAAPKPERGVYHSPLNRDALKVASHTVGFNGPRGFKTPVHRMEQIRKGCVRLETPAGRRTQAERERALELAALAKEGIDKR